MSGRLNAGPFLKYVLYFLINKKGIYKTFFKMIQLKNEMKRW
jgi:hypothetical protein